MNITTTQAAGLSVATLTNEELALQEKKAAEKKELDRAGSDTVSISEEGMEKSAALAKSSDTSSNGSGGGRNPSTSDQSVDVKSLEKELQTKESDISSAKAEIGELEQQAADDPAKKAELARKRQELSDLEGEASAIQVDLYA